MFTKVRDKSMPEYRIAIRFVKELKYIATRTSFLPNPEHGFGESLSFQSSL
jgi:hypothetical protein